MCCKRVLLIVIASFLLFTYVNGSCLEYGHSCWGAHGKRSGGSATKSLRSSSHMLKAERNGNERNKANYGKIDDNQREKNEIFKLSETDTDEEKSMNFRDIPRLKNIFLKYNTKLRNRNSINDDSLEQENGIKERWQRFPIFNLKPFTKSQSENELVQQPSKRISFEDSVYYDLL